MDLSKLLNEMKSKYKDEVILGLAEEETFEVKCIPTGLIGVDYVIGRPGIPAWRLTQIAGFDNTGKSLLGLCLLVSFQRNYREGIPVLINTEYSLDPDFFERLGGDPERLLVFTPKTAEKVFEVFEELVKVVRKKYGKNPHILCVIDSLSIATEYEIKERNLKPGEHARLLSHIFRKIRNKLYEWNATLVYISQNKQKIPKSNFGIYSGKETTRLGGYAVEYAPVLTLEVSRIKNEKDDEGETIREYFGLEASKNHVSVPFRKTILLYETQSARFRNGFNMFRFLMRKGIIKEGGKGWYEYRGKKYREKDLIQVLEEDKEVEISLRKELNIDLNKENLL